MFKHSVRFPAPATLFIRLVVVVACLCASHLQAQQPQEPPKPPAQDDVEVLRVKSNLVNIDVMVKDKKGNYVTDLKTGDFTVFENGVKQEVTFFEPPLSDPDNTTTSSTLESRTSAANGQPRNIISLVLDVQTTALTNLKQVSEGTIKYIREQIADSDTVALFSITSGLRILQPFTQDKEKLIAAVENAYSGSASNKNLEQLDNAGNIATQEGIIQSSGGALPGSITTAAGGSTAAQAMIAARVLQQFIKLRSALNVQQSRPILAALAAICEALRGIPGKKTLVMFSQGFITPQTLDWQVQSTIDIATRANVSISVIDSAGLKAGASQSGGPAPRSPLAAISAATNQEQRIQAVGGETVFDYARQEGPDRGYDILYRIAGDTGGQFIKNTNDIGKALNRIDREIRSRYTLAYQSSDPNFDGGFRKLRIEVSRADMKVISRAGYYALPHDEVISLSPEDKRLLTTITAEKADDGLRSFVEFPAFRFQEGHYLIPLSIELPPDAVKFERKNDKQLMQLEVLGVVRGKQDKVLSRLGGIFNVALSAEQFRAIQNNKIFFRQDVELAPGAYLIELVLRDKLSGKTSARRARIDLPGAGDFSTSGIVLSRHVEAAPLQLGRGTSTDVLIQGGVRIRPAPSREFHNKDNLIIFFEVYDAAVSAETNKPRVRVTVTLMKESRVAAKPITYDLTEVLKEPTPHLTFLKYIALDRLPLGRYKAKIETKDTVTGNLTEKEVSFAIIPD